MSSFPFVFKKKRDDTVGLPIDTSTIELAARLKMHSISLNYNIDRLTSKYYASVRYCEYPEDYKNKGMQREINIDASSWQELIDKVADCLGEGDE